MRIKCFKKLLIFNLEKNKKKQNGQQEFFQLFNFPRNQLTDFREKKFFPIIPCPIIHFTESTITLLVGKSFLKYLYY